MKPQTEERPPEDYPFRFSCQRSGNCCSIPGGVVRVTEDEIAAIATHLQMTVAAFCDLYITAGGDRLVEGFTSACVFLDSGSQSSCQIYPVRPKRCATWPFWPELRDDQEALSRATKYCPGIEPR